MIKARKENCLPHSQSLHCCTVGGQWCRRCKQRQSIWNKLSKWSTVQWCRRCKQRQSIWNKLSKWSTVRWCRLCECGRGSVPSRDGQYGASCPSGQWVNGADGVSRGSQYGINCPSVQRCNGADSVNVVEVVGPAEAVNIDQVVYMVNGAIVNIVNLDKIYN